jgi:hypothetical protein
MVKFFDIDITVNASYEHEVDVYQRFLIDQIISAYGFIPIVGPILGIFVNFLNSPSLSVNGLTTVTPAYFINIIQFCSIIGVVIINIYSKGNTYIILFIVFLLLSVVDSMNDGPSFISEQLMLNAEKNRGKSKGDELV